MGYRKYRECLVCWRPPEGGQLVLTLEHRNARFWIVGIALVDPGVVRRDRRPFDECLRHAVSAPRADASRSTPALSRGASHANLAVVEHRDRDEGVGCLSPQTPRVR